MTTAIIEEVRDDACALIEGVTGIVYVSTSDKLDLAIAAATMLSAAMCITVEMGEPATSASFSPDGEFKIDYSGVAQTYKVGLIFLTDNYHDMLALLKSESQTLPLTTLGMLEG